VISVALETYLEIRLVICIYKTSLLHRPDDYIGFTPVCAPHILQQNCAHALYYYTNQARRPEFNSRGDQKPKGGPHFKNTVLDVCSNLGAKRETGAQISNGGAGHHWPPRWRRA